MQRRVVTKKPNMTFNMLSDPFTTPKTNTYQIDGVSPQKLKANKAYIAAIEKHVEKFTTCDNKQYQIISNTILNFLRPGSEIEIIVSHVKDMIHAKYKRTDGQQTTISARRSCTPNDVFTLIFANKLRKDLVIEKHTYHGMPANEKLWKISIKQKTHIWFVKTAIEKYDGKDYYEISIMDSCDKGSTNFKYGLDCQCFDSDPAYMKVDGTRIPSSRAVWGSVFKGKRSFTRDMSVEGHLCEETYSWGPDEQIMGSRPNNNNFKRQKI